MGKNDIIVTGLENDDIIIQMGGNVVTWAELNGKPEQNRALINLLTRLLNDKVDKKVIEAGTHTKITYDENGIIISGEDLTNEDLPDIYLEDVVDVEATAEEVNKLHNMEATTEELNILHGATITTSELNLLHGLTLNTEELNSLKNAGTDISGKLDKNPAIRAGVATKVAYDENGLITGAEPLEESDLPQIKLIKISDVNIPSGELNQLNGLRAYASDINKLVGIEGNVQEQFNDITNLIPRETSNENKLADKQFVKNWVYDHAGYYLTAQDKQDIADIVKADVFNWESATQTLEISL